MFTYAVLVVTGFFVLGFILGKLFAKEG